VNDTSTLAINGGKKLTSGAVTMKGGTTLSLPDATKTGAAPAEVGSLAVESGATVTLSVGGASIQAGTYTLLTATGTLPAATAFDLVADIAEGNVATLSVVDTSLVLTVELAAFAENDVVSLKDGTATLTQMQADWLNGIGARADVEAVLGNVEAADFGDAALLNLDVTKQDWNVWGLVDTAIATADVAGGARTVTVVATLSRAHAVQKAGGGDAPVNGKVRLYAIDLATGAKTLVGAAVADDSTFSNGNTATFTFETDIPSQCFKAVITAK